MTSLSLPKVADQKNIRGQSGRLKVPKASWNTGVMDAIANVKIPVLTENNRKLVPRGVNKPTILWENN
ncbi:hypothetical protein [Brunnivagina elsteri]|uniref:hypothetical protein n=1 Tax=Brunnivagina elsteri TaxID=1247191 RepID=UPI0013043E5A|nr:hypothetical protein [Calothrix elsteri]